ncbi:MAG: hypothetical protein ACO319_03955 [Candidatus Nanopelagicaceae bacterium]
MIRKALVLLLSLVFTAITALVAPSSQSEEYFAAETPFWVDCSLAFRSTDCVESVEFSDPASERKDANGQLDYSSIVWKKTVPVLNPKFVYKQTSYDMKSFSGGDTCEGIPPNPNTGKTMFLHDACYTASGLLPDGKDLVFRLMISGSGPFFSIYQWVDKGERRTWNREDGWEAQTVPDGSTWRITLRSNSIAKNTGTITSNMKNPLVTFGKGSDGTALTYIQGTVFPNQWQCLAPGKSSESANDRIEFCKHPESYAQTASTGFSIDLMPYVFQFEKLKGYQPGGIFVSGPTGHLGQVQYNQDEGAIVVPMSGPHFLFDRKTLNKGWMEVSIKGDVIRKAFNLEPSLAGQIARVEISYEEGKSDVATYNSRYLKDLDVFEIRAYNFGFSAPTVTLRMPPAKKNSSAAGTPGKQNSASSKTFTITCVKGKMKKTVTGKSPKCPKGYVKR